MQQVSDIEMKKTIADFLELGHVDNIVALFKQEPDYYKFAGDLINDERFIVRMGMVVLFEELVSIRPSEVRLAMPSLISLLEKEIPPYVRGEALTILGLIGTSEAIQQLQKYVNDPDPQLAEIATDYLQEIIRG